MLLYAFEIEYVTLPILKDSDPTVKVSPGLRCGSTVANLNRRNPEEEEK
jgi:hypothetical protein